MWTQARIEQYITDEIEENHRLDYKAAGSLGKTNAKKQEITKDVSAMANSDGGLIIYGIREYQEKDKAHLPEGIDPIIRTNISKEWLEHIINNIRPRITEIMIHSISLNSGDNDVVYVVEIPKSSTAHQAMDKRYYKRFNFESTMMEDYEIRDIMNRDNGADLDIHLTIYQDNTLSDLDEETKYLRIKPYVTSRNQHISERGMLKIMVSHPLQIDGAMGGLNQGIEPIQKPFGGFPGIDAGADVIKLRWGIQGQVTIFPDDWHALPEINLKYSDFDGYKVFFVLTELFTQHQAKKVQLHYIYCLVGEQESVNIYPVAEFEYTDVKGKFGSTHSRYLAHYKEDK